MSKDEIIRNIQYLTDDELTKALTMRLLYVSNFNQLKPGMFFLEQSGYDHFKKEIISVNYESKTFSYRDHSMVNFPDEHKKIHTTKEFPFLPSPLFRNKIDFENRIEFEFL